MKKLAVLFTALMMLWTVSALAEGEFPALNADGFLDEGEFVYENAEDGVWRYASPTLKVEVLRCHDTDPVKVWYEAEVWTRPGENWYMALAAEGKHFSVNAWPYLVAQRNGSVLAINNDFAQSRYPKKNKSVGIIIREGNILWSKTRKANYGGFPNLDTIALFPDGSMQVFDSDEKTAEEYIEMGATEVLSFGPYLIRDGVLNEEGFQLAKGNAPRTAIGMVEPGHYWAMMLEGRSKASKGAPISFLAYRLQEKGCVTAFNLDGGETACMLFMGKQINEVGGTKNKGGSARRTSELLAVGVSGLVEGYEAP